MQNDEAVFCFVFFLYFGKFLSTKSPDTNAIGKTTVMTYALLLAGGCVSSNTACDLTKRRRAYDEIETDNFNWLHL